jgi:hypothetical protein
MIKKIIYKCLELMNKERNFKLREIESYLLDLSFKVNLDPTAGIIEFNKAFINKTIYSSSLYKYQLDGASIRINHTGAEKMVWLCDYIDSDKTSNHIKDTFELLVHYWYSRSDNSLINNCVSIKLDKHRYDYIIRISKNELKFYVNFFAKKNDMTDFLIQIEVSLDDNRVLLHFAPTNAEIEETIECFGNPIEHINEKLRHKYMIHFLNDYALFNLLGLSSKDEYEQETHGELIKMFYI